MKVAFHIQIGLLVLAFTTCLKAQDFERTDELPAILVGIHYGYGSPLEDMADRFGDHSAIGLSPAYMFSDGWLVGATARFFWGNRVKPNVAGNLMTSQGFIIGNNQGPARFSTKERAWGVLAKTGKIFDWSPSPSRIGLKLEAGVGILWHKIRLQDDNRSIIQLSDPYQKGYDRLSGGMAGSLDVAFHYMAADRGLSFSAGANLLMASTRSWRKYNYDTMMPDTDGRFDGLITAYVSFILPIYGSVDSSKIYY